ncbi:TonB family protein [Kordiimonas sp. SCSIO 12610]|uniref:TonB family protein n=1 Tax=Kordiimonas sp. SCSIO 12610 TaxID=2829597 RepID=UPI00210E9D0A|nr:TonB family protein [Kordiimonas sp. SCSIO 12610]UTW54022.1 TonB family protein [Kordiimonas sp. SCSIO 12610]
MAIKTFRTLLVCLFVTAASAFSILSDDGIERKSYSISKKFHKIFLKADKAFKEKDIAKARQIVDKQFTRKNNPYEEYLLWNFMLNFVDSDNSEETISYLVNAQMAAKKIKPSIIETSLLYSLSQAYFATGNYDDAHEYFLKWAPKDKEINVQHLAYISQLYYMRGKLKNAVKYAEEAITLHEENNLYIPDKSWYEIALNVQLEFGDIDRAVSHFEKAIAIWPDATNVFCSHIANIQSVKHGKDNSMAKMFANEHFKQCRTIEMNINGENILATPVLNSVKKIQDSETCQPSVRVQPEYPKKAVRKRIQGRVIVDFEVLPDGSVVKDSIDIISAVPKGYFEKSAIRAASLFKYSSINGEVYCGGKVRYNFTFALNY